MYYNVKEGAMIMTTEELHITLASVSEDSETFACYVFGAIADVGDLNRIVRYHSDLGRDVFWLQRNANEIAGGMPFYWTAREHGSSVGFDLGLVRYGCVNKVYRFQVQRRARYDDIWLSLTVSVVES